MQKKVAPSNRLMAGITCFAWNKDRSQIAVCPNSLEIWIFKTNQ